MHCTWLLLAVHILLVPFMLTAQRLDRFGSVSSGLYRNGKPAGIAYQQYIRYFGFVSLPDNAQEYPAGRVVSRLFFSLTDSVTELGLRVLSPVPQMAFPDKGDLVSENYFPNEKDKARFFNPQLRLYLARPNPQLPAGQAEDWILLAENDNSRELPMQPDGKYGNSLIRLYDKKDPLKKSIAAGTYKIELWNADSTLCSGSYIVEAGCISDLPVMKWKE